MNTAGKDLPDDPGVMLLPLCRINDVSGDVAQTRIELAEDFGVSENARYWGKTDFRRHCGKAGVASSNNLMLRADCTEDEETRNAPTVDRRRAPGRTGTRARAMKRRGTMLSREGASTRRAGGGQEVFHDAPARRRFRFVRRDVARGDPAFAAVGFTQYLFECREGRRKPAREPRTARRTTRHVSSSRRSTAAEGFAARRTRRPGTPLVRSPATAATTPRQTPMSALRRNEHNCMIAHNVS